MSIFLTYLVLLILTSLTGSSVKAMTLDDIVKSTYRILDTKGRFAGTCVIAVDESEKRKFLITAGHVLDGIAGDTLVLISRIPDGVTHRDFKIALRQKGKNFYKKHLKNVDVAVLEVTLGLGAFYCLEVKLFASKSDWNNHELHSGDELKAIGFPRGFQHTSADLPFVRTCWIGSIVARPFDTLPDFIIDGFLFNGNSGGPVVLPAGGKVAGLTVEGGGWRILGLVQGGMDPFAEVYIYGKDTASRILDQSRKDRIPYDSMVSWAYPNVRGVTMNSIGATVCVKSTAVLEVLEYFGVRP